MPLDWRLIDRAGVRMGEGGEVFGLRCCRRGKAIGDCNFMGMVIMDGRGNGRDGSEW